MIEAQGKESIVRQRYAAGAKERADKVCCLVDYDSEYLQAIPREVIERGYGCGDPSRHVHEGETVLSNLAFACPICNRLKGSDLGTISRSSRTLIRFFNPRFDQWHEHFRLNGALIEGQSEIGEGTARMLGFNREDRRLERLALMATGRYPSIAAMARTRI